jgi:hypothetical protein
VWVKTDHLTLPQGLSRKLSAKWIGPFPILAAINPVAMHVELPTTLRLHPVLHVSNLKHHHGQVLQRELPTFETEQDSEYEVAAIVKHRVSRG